MSSQMLDIPTTAIISTAPEQIASELGGEAVILNLATGMYYGLNEVGARVWELIQQPCTFDSILYNLLEEYDVQPDLCKQDLTKILVEMKEACLIEVSNEQTA
ncbi:PqqD family peptide modification chaperone [Leptothoe spongobia]|uniref:PqqD family protein n=1 Tax=Leptothoe spongobia TAU-MAC 1115 TaxID=1967444 RepID=A0A947GHJ1_9CYAN|nr:PqqD family peptide modification chaperone [Leptothoe spongobia]MBT9314728.1 PqqD family protein [Leptothoe spongobia TAU-MAC 1115]